MLVLTLWSDGTNTRSLQQAEHAITDLFLSSQTLPTSYRSICANVVPPPDSLESQIPHPTADL